MNKRAKVVSWYFLVFVLVAVFSIMYFVAAATWIAPTTNQSIGGTYTFNATTTLTGALNASFGNGTGNETEFAVVTNTSAGQTAFWVSNATSYFGEGNHTFNVTFDNGTTLDSEIVSATVDNTAPVVTLIAPVNATSSTVNAYNFTFNVTDTNAIANCTLVMDDLEKETLSTITKNVPNGIYKSALSALSFTWSINCTDAAGNVINSSNRILVVTPTGTPSGGGGGGGGGTVFTIQPRTFKKGYTKEMNENWKLQFTVESEMHTLTVKHITSTTVKIQVSSIVQEITLLVGQEKKFELTGDSYYDLSVKVDEVKNNRATLTLMSIHEKIPTTPTIPTTDEAVEEEEPAPPKTTRKEPAPIAEMPATRGGLYFGIIAIVIVVIIIIFIIIFMKKRK